MQHFSPDLYPNLAKLDEKISQLLATPQAKSWDTVRCEYEISRRHPIYWMEEYGYIKSDTIEGGDDVAVKIIPFILNTSQLVVADKICGHLLDKQWSRVQLLILKHRKVGMSTEIAAFDYWLMRFIPNFYIFLIADLASHTDNISMMVELYQERDLCGAGLEDELMTPPRRLPMPRTKKGMRLSNGSIMELGSGENDNPGTSGTIQACHMSENSKWRNPQIAETSLLNSIPRKGFVFIVKESTAFGLNKYAQDCETARKGLSNWEFVFVSWKDLPDCEYVPALGETIDFDEDEKALASIYKLTPGHIKFRRSQIEMLGSFQQFKQDFPLNPQEPFLTSGANYFNTQKVQDYIHEINFFRDWKNIGWDYVVAHYPEVLHRLKSNPQGLKQSLSVLDMNHVLPQYAMLTVNRERVTAKVGKYKPDQGALTMYRSPFRENKYLVTVDVAEGIQNSEYTSDSSIIEVFDTRRREQVAEWGGVFDEEMTAIHAVLIARLYGKADIACEMNNKCGGLLQANLQNTGYRNFFHRQRISGQQIKREFGWHTSRGNKKETCGQLKQDFKNGDCTLHSIPLLEEMLFFIDNAGILGASSGHTDDRVMATSINLKITADTPAYREAERKRATGNSPRTQIYPEYMDSPLMESAKQRRLGEAVRRYR